MRFRNQRDSLGTIQAAAVIFSTALFFAVLQSPFALAQGSKIKVGRTVGGSGFHIPSYVAMDKGFFKSEGLDAAFIATTGGVLVRAAIAKEIEFVPIPAGGSEAILQGAPLVFVVGQSLISQWTLTTSSFRVFQIVALMSLNCGESRIS